MTDLETALLEECSATDIYCICKGKPLPESLRAEVWQVSLCFSICNHQILFLLFVIFADGAVVCFASVFCFCTIELFGGAHFCLCIS